MSSRRGDAKRLAKAIKPYGFTIVFGKKHRHILNMDGKAVAHMSTSPSCPFFAANALSDLKRMGLVPREVRL